MGRTDLFAAVKDLAFERKSLYRGSIKERRKLLDFLEMNGWFGQDVEVLPGNTALAGKNLYVTEEQASALCSCLHLWLDGFRKGNSEKLEILMRYGEKTLPQTAALFRDYISAESLEDDISSWRLFDFLLFHLPAEITRLNTEEMEKLVDTLDIEATRAVSELYAGFNAWIQKKLGISGWQYRFEYRKKREETEAYTVRQFSGMAYCLFNEEWWERQGLVEKACESAAQANLWVFLAMHFVCGLRSTDIVRIPKPDLGVPGETFREKAVSGTVESPEAVSRDVQIRIRFRPRRPNKTMASSGISDLKVFIPVSLEKPMGIILGIAASHHPETKPGESFIRADRSVSRMRRFLGNDFMDILGGKGFASSRANKAYLQGLEMMADSSEGSMRGYMIAALARSHKGGLGTLPDVTDIYLRDAAFSGYKPEFIAREMFERGVFGFIPHLLLEVYAGSEYTGLTIPEQTSLIREVGIRPSGIESIVRMCETSLAKAKETVSDIVSSGMDVAVIVQEIASGRAVSKQEGCLCAMTGGGFPCVFPERPACVGCRYEIHTKSILHHLSSEYARMRDLSGGSDGWRYRAMMKKAVLPVIGEYLACTKDMVQEADMGALSQIMEGGLSGYAYCGEQTGGNGLQQVPGG